MVAKTGITIPQHVGEAAEINYRANPRPISGRWHATRFRCAR